jgi:hypothetical protein
MAGWFGRWIVTDGAKPSRPVRIALWLGCLAAGACASEAPAPHPSYDSVTRRLVRLDADTTGDGRPDARTFLDGGRLFRAEIVADGSWRVTRWEYFDERSELVQVGTSSAHDGIEDTWTSRVDDEGERAVYVSTARDRRVDRREYFRGDELVRVEQDTSGDGRIDKWEHYEGGVLRRVAFDTTRRRGQPDRRVTYDAEGRFLYLEVDAEGNGRFERVEPDADPGARR